MIKSWENIKKLIEYAKGGILSKELVKSPKSNVTLFCMGEGTEISEHTSTKEGLVYCLEGKGIFQLEGEGVILESGILIHMKQNAVHRIKASQNLAFLLILLS